MKHTRAFSLVELSIVLVILGLLTGGILAGQNLIRAAELRAVTTEYDRYVSAVHTFRDKYFALPGDMNNAEDFWGTMTASCPTGNSVGGSTCNGDGDGAVEGPASAGQAGERFTFWQHLANAGLIEGSYTGKAGAGDSEEHIGGTNAPISKFGLGLWFAGTANNFPGTVDALAGDYGNYLFIGGTASGGAPVEELFTPEEAWNIDTKMDDGQPGRGNIWTYYFDTCGDAGSNTDYTGSYRLTVTSQECALYFRNAF